jgi:hypothetical protein
MQAPSAAGTHRQHRAQGPAASAARPSASNSPKPAPANCRTAQQVRALTASGTTAPSTSMTSCRSWAGEAQGRQHMVAPPATAHPWERQQLLCLGRGQTVALGVSLGRVLVACWQAQGMQILATSLSHTEQTSSSRRISRRGSLIL